MKKMILAAILATVSAVSMAEGTNGHFTGFGVGAELGATDWSDGGRTVAAVKSVCRAISLPALTALHFPARNWSARQM